MLDLERVTGQIGAMIDQLKYSLGEKRASLERALGLLNDQKLDVERLKQKAAVSRTTFLVAGVTGPLRNVFQPAPIPPAHSVIATDGSQIGVDRHQAARCFLINIGRVRLDYGPAPAAELASLPRLYAGDDMALSCGTRRQTIDANLLGVKRAVEEAAHLAEMAGALPDGAAALAVLDGSLIMWSLASKDIQDFVVEELLDRGYLAHLARIQSAAAGCRLALASYISFPRSTDVVNTLRLAVCPHEPADCDRHCREIMPGSRPCDVLAAVQDSDLFQNHLAAGERSALFISQSQIVSDRYGAQRVYFFYLQTGQEMARVEIPEWVAADPARLELAHSLILDQCRRGQGYPVALAEAHEQAVVTAADTDQFRRLVEEWLNEEHVAVNTSAKSSSKRTRWV